ncbi:MAG TPA: cupin domain-containing protein [Steroidobacteraceae bacterium]|nr:cupin domain-containing protein [Steroidobacteraceae bacterium]
MSRRPSSITPPSAARDRHRARRVRSRLIHRDQSRAEELSPGTTLIGAKLREQRRHLDLTLQEVADRAGITKGFLSEVERDRATPSVATLLKLRDALSLSVATLFRSSLPQVVRRGERQSIPYGGIGMSCSMLSARNAHRAIAVHGKFAPGGRSGDDPHTLDSDEEIIVILSGSLEVTVRGETHLLRAGDTITFDPRIPHSYRNPSKRQSTQTLCIVAPPPK